MKQVQVKRSIEGGKYQKITIDVELFNALSEYHKLNDVFTYLVVNNLIDLDSKIFNHFSKTNENCGNIFKKYKLDKYDIRAHYIFEEAVEINI